MNEYPIDTMEGHLKSLYDRIEYLEKIVDELKYLASCQGWKFDHIKKPNESVSEE